MRATHKLKIKSTIPKVCVLLKATETTFNQSLDTKSLFVKLPVCSRSQAEASFMPALEAADGNPPPLRSSAP